MVGERLEQSPVVGGRDAPSQVPLLGREAGKYPLDWCGGNPKAVSHPQKCGDQFAVALLLLCPATIK